MTLVFDGSCAESHQHKENPEQVREEIFSRLCAMHAQDDRQIRRSATAALGDLGTDRAAEQLMKLLEDPDEWVRDTAVFVLGLLRYKPALDAIRRRTRDSSKQVRKKARMMVDRIECDSP